MGDLRNMTPDIVVVDYGAGNLRSVAKTLERIGFPAKVSSSPKAVLEAQGVILPGVGSSGSAMAALEQHGLIDPLREIASRGTPFFGVCLGLQVLLENSEEDSSKCLGIVPGKVKLLPQDEKVPHMGWNQVRLMKKHPLFQNVPSNSYFYFVHSYYAQPEVSSQIIGETDHSITFCSALAMGNVVATQFHPEKSGRLGQRLYENFVQLMVLEGARG